MPSAATLNNETRFMGLFIGRSGSGKTGAECSFPGPIKVFDFDGRIRGILGCPWITEDMKKQIDYTYYPPRVAPNDKANYIKLNDELEYMLDLSTKGKLEYKTVILDSLTSTAFALLSDAIPLTHAEGQKGDRGKSIGKLKMPGPEDYGFEANNIYNILSFFRSLPIQNVIVSAHTVDKFGKKDIENKYAESEVVGEKLSVRDKIGENVQIYFDHVFKFDRYESAGQIKHTVKFRSDIARTSFQKAPNEIDITGKNFYDVLKQYQ